MKKPARKPPFLFRSSECDPDSTKCSNIFYSSSSAPSGSRLIKRTNRANGYEFRDRTRKLHQREGTTEGLRVTVESSHPAKHKITGHNVTSVPAFPYP